jgi:hypothetical protein
MSKILNPQAMLAVLKVMAGVNAVHEHTAWNVEMNLEQDTAALQMLGHSVVLEVPGIAVFTARGKGDDQIRIELIQQGVKQHEAWLVKTLADFMTLRERFSHSHDFKMNPKEHLYPHLHATMFIHKSSGGVIQIVWRRKQIYPGLFKKK